MTVASEGFLKDIYGESFVVNSAHHQGVDRPGQGIEYVQYADDGVVEGLCHGHLPVFGVQWHPERLCFPQQKLPFARTEREKAADGAKMLVYFKELL